MAPLKRKRSFHDESAGAVAAGRPSSATARRATRQTAVDSPLPVLPHPEPRRRRRRGNSNEQQQLNSTDLAASIAHGKENIPIQSSHDAPLKPTRITRHSGGVEPAPDGSVGRPTTSTSVGINNHNTRLNHVFASAPAAASPAARRPPTRSSGSGPGSARQAATALQSHAHTVGHSKPLTIATSSPHAAATPRQQQRRPSKNTEGGKPSRSDRNIDKVVLGNICFRAWYPSYYGKEVLGDISGNSGKSGSGNSQPSSDAKDEAAIKAQGRKEKETLPILDRLYVCPCCFKYSRELVTWWEHVRVCERRGFLPGERIYVHPKQASTRLVDPISTQKPPRGKRGQAGAKVAEEVVHDQGEWSIWEVDGEKDVVRSSFLRFEYLHVYQTVILTCKITALLPKSFLVRKAVSRQQICLLRCYRLQLLPSRSLASDEPSKYYG